MSPEDYKDLMETAPKAIAETIELVGREYDALWSAFEERGRTMKKAAANLRDIAATPEGYSWSLILEAQAQELDPIEPLSEADAADKFSKDCAARKPTASSEPSGSEQP